MLVISVETYSQPDKHLSSTVSRSNNNRARNVLTLQICCVVLCLEEKKSSPRETVIWLPKGNKCVTLKLYRIRLSLSTETGHQYNASSSTTSLSICPVKDFKMYLVLKYTTGIKTDISVSIFVFVIKYI